MRANGEKIEMQKDKLYDVDDGDSFCVLVDEHQWVLRWVQQLKRTASDTAADANNNSDNDSGGSPATVPTPPFKKQKSGGSSDALGGKHAKQSPAPAPAAAAAGSDDNGSDSAAPPTKSLKRASSSLPDCPFGKGTRYSKPALCFACVCMCMRICMFCAVFLHSCLCRLLSEKPRSFQRVLTSVEIAAPSLFCTLVQSLKKLFL